MRIKCQIAGLNIEFETLSEMIEGRLAKYVTTECADYLIQSEIVENVSIIGKMIYTSEYYDIYENDGVKIQVQRNLQNNEILGTISYFEDKAVIKMVNHDLFYAEYLMTQYATFHYILTKKEALVIHSSAINYKGKAYLFCAKSGTGKSTHTKMWVDEGYASYINDDKNIVIYEKGIFNVYGNPWSGKHGLDNNVTIALGGILYITRSIENHIEKLTKKDSYFNILSHTVLPNPFYSKAKWNNLIFNLLSTNAYSLQVNISKDAVLVAKKELDGDNFEIEK